MMCVLTEILEWVCLAGLGERVDGGFNTAKSLRCYFDDVLNLWCVCLYHFYNSVSCAS